MHAPRGRRVPKNPLAASILVLCLAAGAAAAEVRVEVLPEAATATVDSTATPRALTAGPGLVLPFYLLDKLDEAGETTLYAVRNNGDAPLTVLFRYHQAFTGGLATVEQAVIQPNAVRTVNFRSIPGLPGQGGIATGYLVVEAPAGAPAGVLSGDWFRVDPAGAAANGGALLDADTAGCRRWSHRFLQGGGFSGGTKISFVALDAPLDGPTVSGNVFNESGAQVATVEVTSDRAAFEIDAADLDLPVNFGSIDWVFEGDGHGVVSNNFTANGLFSIGVEAACTEDFGPAPPTNDVVFELPGTFLNCNNCANWQYDMPFGGNRQFDKVTIDFDLYVSAWDPHNTNGFHCLFWLNDGGHWRDMMGYLNSRGSQNRMVFQVNGPLGNPIGVEKYKSPGISEGQTFHVHYEYDTVEDIVWYAITDSSGNLRVSDSIPLPSNTGPISTNYTFIQFGAQPNDVGPEARTNGWRWSNFRAAWTPAE